jgi:hypothetical protein
MTDIPLFFLWKSKALNCLVFFQKIIIFKLEGWVFMSFEKMIKIRCYVTLHHSISKDETVKWSLQAFDGSFAKNNEDYLEDGDMWNKFLP